MKHGVVAELLPKVGRWPGVFGALDVAGVRVLVAAVHLEPGLGGAEERRRQLTAVSSEEAGAAMLILGDFNVRMEEEEVLLQKTGCRNAFYSGASWDPKVVQYDENLKSLSLIHI